MNGVSKLTGKALDGIDHLRQSIIDILTTPLGTRVMRRQYGSKVFDYIDAPLNSETLLFLFAAIAEALDKWEPRLRLQRVQATNISDTGRVNLLLTALYLPDGKSVQIDGIVI
jgi:phage baseplate assembly protein W